MARTLDLYQLISQPESYRDEEWESAFLQSITEAQVQLVSEDPQTGPDGWPYIFVKTASEGREPIGRIFSWLSERGIGMAVNPHKMVPDYIFTYGMIWNFRENGRFITKREAGADRVIYKKEENWIFGPPAETYLPKYVRKVLREFFEAQKVPEPKILVASSADFSQTDLLVSLESLGNPPPEEHRRVAEAISWFLPIHYSIVLTSEKEMPRFGLL